MKNRQIMFLIHKYGMYYSLSLYVLLLAHIEIYVTSLNFWLLLFCFCLNMYFIFHKGMVYAIGKQNSFEQFKEQMIKAIAEKTYKEIEEEKEKEDNKLN